MSASTAKAQLQAALQSITWSIPTSAQGIAAPALKTTFGRVDTQILGEEVSEEFFPLARIRLPDLPEKRLTSGGDTGSIKVQRPEAHVFIYTSGYAADGQGLGDYFDAILDATMAYFSRHSSPQPGVPLVGGDLITGWGLHMRLRREDPQLFDDTYVYSATLGIDLIISKV